MPYDAFLSYSRKDSAFASWLEAKLERYRPPAGLSLDNRKLEVFRDVQDLVGNELSDALKDAIRNSQNLIVVCSTRSRLSEWVGKEIDAFAEYHGGKKIIPILVDGRPNSEVRADDPTQDQAFPAALMAQLHEPLAADFRTWPGQSFLERREKRQEALFQVLALLLGTQKEALVRRHLRRTRRFQSLALTISVALVVLFAWLAYTANENAKEARRQEAIAVQERRIAVGRQLAAEAVVKDDGTAFGLHLSALLSVEALKHFPTPEGVEVAERVSSRLPRTSFEEHVGQGASIAISPDGEWLVATTARGLDAAQIRAWRRTAPPGTAKMLERPTEPSEIAISNDGNRIATWEFDGAGRVHVLELDSQRSIASFPAGSGPIALAPAGEAVAFLDANGVIEVWRLEGPRMVNKVKPPDRINALVLGPRGDALTMLTYSGTIAVWEVTRRQLVQPHLSIAPLVGEEGAHQGQQFIDRSASTLTADGEMVATGDASGNVQVWDARRQTELQRALHGDRHVQAVALSADGNRVAAVSFSGHLRAWDVDRPSVVPGFEQDALATTLSGDGRRVAAGAKRRILVLDAETRRELANIEHGLDLKSVALSRNGSRLAAANADDLIRVWDLDSQTASARIETTPEAFGGSLGAIAVSDDGKRVAVGGDFEIVKVLASGTGAVLLSARGSGGTVPSRGSVTFDLSSNGRLLVVGDESGFVDLWEVESKKVVGSLDIGSAVREVVFGPEDVYFATHTTDDAIRVWSTGSLLELARIRINGPVRAIAFPSSSRLLTVDDRGRRREHLWQSQELIAEVCSRLIINMSPGKWRQYLGTEPYQRTCPSLEVPDETERAGATPAVKRTTNNPWKKG